MQNFLIIISGYNCQHYVAECINSIKNQTLNFMCVVVDDGSTDYTLSKILNHTKGDKRFYIINNQNNTGAAFCRYKAIKTYGKENDIIILVGLDDELLPGALEKISEQYKKGKWMTYGNWKNQFGEMLPEWFHLDFDEETHQNRDYRKVKYRSTAPNTFYKFLFDKIPLQDFKIDGKWIDTTTESELMFSCLEMCGKDRIGIINEPIYLYNQNLPTGTQRRLGQEYKNKVLNIIINRPKRNLYEGAVPISI